ncbi:MAG: efflux RND transporter periplasmic adaptor subunit [Bacteroidetes bacterium]|nr:efflux RND transporter periplasmic adaptor subunit [Bacteroidota bacterium]
MKKNIILAFILLFGIISCTNEEKEKNVEAEKIIVSTTQTKLENYTPKLNYIGTAFAIKEANLGAAIPGRVEKLYYKKGQLVKKGDLLVSLSGELLAQAEIENNAIKKDFDRVKRLKEKGSLSQQDFDHVKAKYDASKEKTSMLRKSAEIRAPFSGTIVGYLVKEGENFFFAPNLSPGYSMTSGIVQLMQLNTLKIKIDVNEKDISKINKGQKAEVVFDAYPNKIFNGLVSNIEPVLSTMTRTAKVEINIKNPALIIKPGMYANVSIKLPQEKAIFVPISAILRQAGTGNDYVFTVKNNKVIKNPVKRITTLEEKVAVSGLKINSEIVTLGKNKIHDGSTVTIKN